MQTFAACAFSDALGSHLEIPVVTRTNLFWWRWMVAWSAILLLFGVATAWLGMLPPMSAWGDLVASSVLAREFTPQELRLFGFMRGPLGGTMAGYYVLQLGLVVVPLRRGERWAWWTILAALLVWFVVDSVVSIAHGAWFNVLLINLFTVLVTVAGLIGTRGLLSENGDSINVAPGR